MSRGVNKVILVGHLGRDPEIRYTPGGTAVANVTIATSEAWKDKQSGEQQEKTEWHRVVFFSRLAEIVGEYLKKGSQVYVEGRLQTRKWQDQSGQDRYSTEIVVNDMQMLGGRGKVVSDVDHPADTGSSRQSAPAAPSSAKSNVPAAAIDEFGDDIPF